MGVVSRPERVTQPFLDVLEAFWWSSSGLHGYELAKKTKRGRPTIYNNLDRLSTLGWITDAWEDPATVQGRPLRKMYHLTPEGQTRARELLVQAGRLRLDDLNAVTDGPGV